MSSRSRRQRSLRSQRQTARHGLTAPPVEVVPAAPVSSPPPPVRADAEPASSEKRTELDLPKVADFVSDEDAIPTTSPTPRYLGRVTPIALPRTPSLQRALPIVVACVVAACILALSWAYAM